MEPTDIILTKDDGCILLSSDLSTILFKVDTTGTIQWCHQLKSDLGTKIIGAKKINVFDTASIVLDGFQLYQVDLDGWSCNYINFPLVDSNVAVTVDTITLWNYVPPPSGLYQSGLTQLSMLPVMPLFPLVDSCLHTVSIPTISSNKNNNIMLFPNPGSSVVSITSDNLFDKIILHDVTCREIKIMKIKNPTANLRVDIRTFPSGIYFVDVYNKEIKIGGMKLLKVE